MKINFNQPFYLFNGEMAKESDGNPQMIKDLLSKILFNFDWSEKKTDKEKFMTSSYNLSQRLFKSDGNLDITVEEASIIKEVALNSIASSGGYVQIVKLIEGE